MASPSSPSTKQMLSRNKNKYEYQVLQYVVVKILEKGIAKKVN